MQPNIALRGWGGFFMGGGAGLRGQNQRFSFRDNATHTMSSYFSAGLQQARVHAQAGRFDALKAWAATVLEQEQANAAALLDVGVLLFNFGFSTQAQVCFAKAQALAPDDLRPIVNQANVARDWGDPESSRQASGLRPRFERTGRYGLWFFALHRL